MFKYNNNTLPESISELFVPYTAIHTYNTRNKHNLRPKQSNRAYMYKNFSFIGVHIWNDIQKHINVSVSQVHLNSYREPITCITTRNI